MAKAPGKTELPGVASGEAGPRGAYRKRTSA